MSCVILVCECFGYVYCLYDFFFLMIRRPPRSTQSRSSAASDVYKRQRLGYTKEKVGYTPADDHGPGAIFEFSNSVIEIALSLIHISEPTRPY